MKKTIKKWFFLVLSITLIIFLEDIPWVFAQESDYDEFTLEEITVTAEKREENQQKVSIAMDVIPGEMLAETGKMDVDDILSSLTNVMINYSEDGMRVGIRGLTNTDGVFNSLTISNPVVAVNLDGAYDRSSSAGQNLFDIERVEVLYGPQSTMYASNSPGGIVNVVTAAPKADKYLASASLEYGNFSLFTAQGMLNAPIVREKFAMRLAVQHQKRDSYISGPNQTGENTKSVRLKALYQPNDDFSATVTGFWSKMIHGGFFGSSVIPFDYQDGHWYTTPPGAPPGTPAAKDGAVTDPWTASSDSAAAGYSGDEITKGISGDIQWDTVIGSLSIVPNYNVSNSDHVGTQTDMMLGVTYTQYTEMKSEQKGIEARMTSPEDFLFEWILGANYYQSKSYRDSTADDPRVADSYSEVTDDTKAAFGNIMYPFTDKFRGIGGIRWSDASAQSIGGLFGVSNAPEFNKPDYRLGMEIDLAENSMLYATYATSYRVNAFRTGIPPERAKTYTVGAKNRFFNNRLQLNGAAYCYDYENVQVQASGMRSETGIFEDEVVDTEGNAVDLNENGVYGEHVLIIDAFGPGGYEDPWAQFQYGAFETIGVDVSLDWIITSKDRLNFSVTYLKSEWVDCKIEAYLKSPDGGNFWEGDGMDYTGFTRTYSPEWTANLGYNHNFQLGSFGVLEPHVDIMYKADYVLSFLPSEYPLNYQEPYYTVDGNLTFTHSSGKWSLNGYVKNATDYAAKSMYGGMSGMTVTDPRTYGAVFSIRF